MNPVGRISLRNMIPGGELGWEGTSMSFDPRRTRARYSLVFLALLFLLLASTPLNSQVAGGTLSGTVTGTTGAHVANAHLTFRNTANGDTKTIIAKEDGSFTFRAPSPGTFEITVSASGFAELKKDVTIAAAIDQTMDIVLQAGSATVPGAAGASGVAAVVSSKSVADLPLNGRSASDLAALEPGVATARTQVTGQAQRGFGTQMTISGGRPRQNNSRLDGISVNDYVNGPPGSALGVNLGSDGVEQFAVLSSNYPAQFGRSSGRPWWLCSGIRCEAF